MNNNAILNMLKVNRSDSKDLLVLLFQIDPNSPF